MSQSVIASFDDAIASIDRHPQFAFDIETTGLNPFKDQLLVLSLATEDGAWAIPFAGPVPHVPWRDPEMSKRIAHVFSDPNKLGISWNGGFDIRFLMVCGFEIKTKDADGMVAAWLLDEMLAKTRLIGLKKQAKILLGVDMDEFESTRLIEGIVDPHALQYAANDAKYTYIIWADHLFAKLQDAGLLKVFERISMPMIRVLVEMEINGCNIDVNRLKKVEQELAKQNDSVLGELRTMSGNPKFNPGSSKQLATLLFGPNSVLKVPVRRGHEWKLKSRQWATDKQTLRRYKKDHPLFEKLTEYRKSKKLLTTYAIPLQERAKLSHDGRVRSNFRLVGTVCVRHDTLIPTDRGLVEIASLSSCDGNAEQPLQIVVASKDGPSKASHLIHNGVRKTRRISTRLGFELEGTLIHPVWVNGKLRGGIGKTPRSERDTLLSGGEWIKLQDLRVDDYVALQRGTNLFGAETAIREFPFRYHTNATKVVLPTKMTPDLALFIGAYVADGSIHTSNGGGTIRISRSDNSAKMIIASAVKECFGVDPGVYDWGIAVSSVAIVNFCVERLGFESGASLKSVPDCIKKSPRDCVLAFLSGLYLDACPLPDRYGVRLDTSSKTVARWVHAQLLNLGVVSAFRVSQSLGIRHHAKNVVGETFIYQVTCCGANAARLSKLITPVQSQLVDYFSRHKNYVEGSRRHYLERGDRVWIRVTDIVDSDADVWDLTVPDTECFIGNGIVSHNTGRLCIAKGTMIDVARDVSKYPAGIPIEDVRPGGYAYCYDDKSQLAFRRICWAGKTGHKHVIRVHWIRDDNQVGGFVDMTPEHRIRVADGSYVAAAAAVPGTRVLGRSLDATDGHIGLSQHIPTNGRTITAIEDRGDIVSVYDIEVEGCHNFIAGGICCHNSSNGPNFQNISSKGGIREAFIPAPGTKLVVADYNQLELRMGGFLAHRVFGKSNIVNQYAQGIDLHEATRRTYDAMGVDRFNEAAVGAEEARRNAKVCVTGDTVLMTDRGLVRIDDVVDPTAAGELRPIKSPLRVASDTDTLPVESIYYGGVKQVFEVTTEHGLQLRCTPEHRCVVLERGEVRRIKLEELHVGDHLLMRVGTGLFGSGVDIPYRAIGGETSYLPWDPPERLTGDVCRVLGYLASEGSWGRGNGGYSARISIRPDDAGIVDDLTSCWLSVFGDRGRVCTRDDLVLFTVSSKDVVCWLGDIGLESGSANIQVPPTVLQAPFELQREFLRGMFSGDGYVASTHRIVGMTLKSERCIRQIQLMLLNIGIVSWVSREERDPYGDFWALRMYGAEAERFITTIGFTSAIKSGALADAGKRSTRYLAGVLNVLEGIRDSVHGLLRDKLTECVTGKVEFGNTRFDLIQADVPETLQWARDGNLWSTKIISIRDVGEEPVYDLVEPTKRLFVTNGLLTEDCNFGYFYGRSADAFAQANPEIPYSEATTLREMFLTKLYPEIVGMHDHCVKDIVETGRVKLITGRFRRFPFCYGRDPSDVWWDGWVAWNSFVQGSSQDLIQIAMRDIFADICAGRRGDPVNAGSKTLHFPASVWERIKLLIQVHDELVMEAPMEVADDVAAWMSYRMGNAIRTPIIEFPAEAGVGDDWVAAKNAPKQKKTQIADGAADAVEEDEDDEDDAEDGVSA
jgi:DNA polymerase I-like protein with 3'-5' exonuclease and polymerase domains